jgi:hypothetical protein
VKTHQTLCGLALGLALAFFPRPGQAQDLAFEAIVDKNTVSLNEPLTLQLVISGPQVNVPRPALPPLPAFQTRNAGQSQNFSFVNGQAFSQVAYSYILLPEAPGDYVIPSFTLEAGGKTLSTVPIPVKVVAGSAPRDPSPGAGAATDQAAQPLFIKTFVDKKTAHVGEPILLSFRFYQRVRLAGQPAYAPADTTGFLSESLGSERNFAEMVGGHRYSVVELRTVLFPTAPGRFTIGPAQLQCRVSAASADPFASLFEDFFSGGRTVTLKSDPISVHVLPLPEAGRPETFKGDVGSYTISAALDKTAVQTFEPVTLTVTVEGEGNIKAVSPPPLPRLDGFKMYETVTSVQASKTDTGLRGSKTFKTVLKPEASGPQEVPAIAFSYFDPLSKSYRTVRSSPLRLTVTPSSRPDDRVSGPGLGTPESVKVLGQDIRFLKDSSRLKPVRARFVESAGFTAINFLPAMGFLGLWAVRRRRDVLAKDPAGVRFQRAYGNAKKGLQRAKTVLAANDLPGYYEALQKTLGDYLGDKLRVPSQSLTWEFLSDELRRRSIPEPLVRSVEDIWNALDTARFAPSLMTNADPNRHGQDVERVLARLEAQWPKSNA